MGRTDNWFVIQTNPQCEQKADGELRRAGLKVYLPKRSYEVKDRRNHGDPKVRFRPLLIGYLFVKFPPDMLDRWGAPQFGVVRGCQGVKGYVRVMGPVGEWEPMAVPNKDVADFMRRQRRREFGRPAIVNKAQKLTSLRGSIKRGDQVRVTDGPFASFLAELERIRDDFTADIEVTFGTGDAAKRMKVNVGIEALDPLVKSALAA